jgi:hypothetical protein
VACACVTEPLKDIEGKPLAPAEEAVEKVFSKHVKDFEKEVEDEEWRKRHPILAICQDGCWDMLKNVIAVMVGIVTLGTAGYNLSNWLGWPNLVSGARLEREIGALGNRMAAYFTNLQRMAWVTRVELLENRRATRKRDREEHKIAIELHSKELERLDVDGFYKSQLQRRIEALKGLIADIDREDEADRVEQQRYIQLLQQSDSGPIGPTTVPPPPDLERLYGQQDRNKRPR